MSETPRFDGLLAETEELAFPYRKQQLRRDDVMYNSEFKQLPQNVVDGVVRPFLRYVRPSCGRLLLLLIGSCAFCHKALTYMVFYPLFRLVFGTLYPAYASYKAVKSKNVREYVKWMMYWIVFAFFTCVETITDVFLSWFPFYYEIKIILVIWLLSPATKGSSFLYRKFVHPMLSNREQEIDEYITKAKEQSYKQVLDLGSKGVNALMQTALKSGGGLVNQIKKSYSLSDLTDRHTREEGIDETDVLITDTRLMRKRQSPRRGPTAPMYFSEIDVRTDAIVSVQSVEDISSSGYSSGEGLTNQSLKLQAREGLVRSGSIGSSKARPTRLTRSTVVPKKSSTTDDDSEAVPDGREPDVIFFNDRIESIDNLPVVRTEPSDKSESSSDGEYVDTVESKSELEELNQTGKSNNIIEPATETVTFKNVHEIKPATNTIAFPQNKPELTIFEQATKTEIKYESSTIEPTAKTTIPPEIKPELSVIEPATKIEIKHESSTIKPPAKTTIPPEIKPELSVIEPATKTSAFPELQPEQSTVEPAAKTSTFSELKQELSIIEPTVKTIVFPEVKSDPPAKTITEIIAESSIVDSNTEILTFYDVPETPEIKPDKNTDDSRGGKYHKRAAPEPPATITATLVLKPGVVKTLDDNVEIFCNSPKSKRRSLSRSRSPSPSRKPAKKESPMTRIMLLPRKMGGFLKHGSLVELRSSSDETLAAARSTASLTSVPEENKKSIKQFFQRRKHE